MLKIGCFIENYCISGIPKGIPKGIPLQIFAQQW